jgi:hypothetical protein
MKGFLSFLSPLALLELAVPLLLAAGAGACGGSTPGRPTLPPPEYEEPSVMDAASAGSAAPTATAAPANDP